MIKLNVVKVISTEADNMKRLLVKILRLGKSDVQTPINVSAYGLDSNPVKDTVAIYVKTETDSNFFIVGYINKNCLAKPGEYRTFATDKDGVQKFYTWMKDDGTMEIGGNTNFAVKYNELKQENDKLKSTVNDLIQKWNAFCSSYAPGSSSSVGTPPTLSTSTVTPNASDWSLSKNDKIKTIG